MLLSFIYTTLISLSYYYFILRVQFSYFRLHYVSVKNVMEIIFHSDETVTKSGWKLRWTSEQMLPCDHHLHIGHQPQYSLQLPHIDSGYHLPHNCSQTIVAPGELW